MKVLLDFSKSCKKFFQNPSCLSFSRVFTHRKKLKSLSKKRFEGVFQANVFFHHKTLTYLQRNNNYPNILTLHQFFSKSIFS
uniref:Putative ovule protein n=1 Tax=Solanum chacoense TaxID=4108 RepID=A0A0V0GY53_SOLCH